MSTQGNRANLSGKNGEVYVNCAMDILRSKNYAIETQYILPELKELPLHSDTLRVDFLVRGVLGHETGLIISSKRLEVDGSAREKLHYHLWVIKNCPPYPTILMMTGEGWKSKEINYAKSQVDNKTLLNVFADYGELLRWAESLPACTSRQRLKANSDLPLFNQLPLL